MRSYPFILFNINERYCEHAHKEIQPALTRYSAYVLAVKIKVRLSLLENFRIILLYANEHNMYFLRVKFHQNQLSG